LPSRNRRRCDTIMVALADGAIRSPSRAASRSTTSRWKRPCRGRLTAGASSSAASPAGSAVLFVGRVDGSDTHVVGDAGLSKIDPAWSPSGAWIAFHGFCLAEDAAAGSYRTSAGLYLVRPDGRGQTSWSKVVAVTSSTASPSAARSRTQRPGVRHR
jgi:Tol biopolymer transport system component